MDEIKKLYKLVQNYCKEYRKESLEPLKIEDPYDLFPKLKSSSITCTYKWPDQWPNSGKAGVYAAFDKKLKLLYIGKASMNSYFGARLGSYFSYTSDGGCLVKHDSWNPRYIVTIGVPDSMTWEAPALEEYLIKTLNPPLNRNGRSIS